MKIVGGNNGWLKVLLLMALATLAIQLHFANQPTEPSHSELLLNAADGNVDMSLRNGGFPRTFISEVRVDLTNPYHFVHLVWKGPDSPQQETGPFHSSPGMGREDVDCDDCDQSRRGGSNCTPKGRHAVEAFSDTMSSATDFKFVTWFHVSREIAFHSHPHIPNRPASHGCVRLDEHAAQLIHNNAIAGQTKVVVDGKWSR